MTRMTVLPRGHDWTVADLENLPDDGLRYELVDGTLLVSAAPSKLHQRALGNLYLLLAVEILSPSSRSVDQVLKRALYEQSGVAHYWVVDPDEPSVTVWDLADGSYQPGGVVRGAEQLALQEPFPVTVVPEGLLR